MTLDVNWLAVLAAGVATFVLGGIWYGPLFERVWRAAEGKTSRKRGGRSIPLSSTACRLC